MSERTLSTTALEECRIPKRFWNTGIDDYFGDKRALSQVEKYLLMYEKAVRQGTGLFFRGNVSSGKTFLMTFALKELMVRNLPVFYIDFDELIDSNLGKSGAVEKFSAKLFDSTIVAVDNINETNSEKIGRSTLLRFLKHRADDGLPFFLASRLVKEGSIDQFHEQFTDEIFELVLNTTIQVKCAADPFEVKRFYDKRKAPIIHAVEGE